MSDILTKSKYFIASFYKFSEINELPHLQSALKKLCGDLKILGTILITPEGINGSLAGQEQDIRSVLNYLETHPSFNDLTINYSRSHSAPFKKLKVLIKKEIITLRQPNVNVSKTTGIFVSPEKWNDLISDPNVLVVDLRNHYETAVGTFKNAVDPKTQFFTEFPKFFQSSSIKNKKQKIAMFCTGGIRCEKASSFLLSNGFENIYQLQGGILNYMEKIPSETSLWQGECFIFDNRGSVNI